MSSVSAGLIGLGLALVVASAIISRFMAPKPKSQIDYYSRNDGHQIVGGLIILIGGIFVLAGIATLTLELAFPTVG